VAIDRAATLRNAEKLLRQGKLDQAITEYRTVVDEFPRDWNTGNILGDLYVRAAQIDKAVDQFIRIADGLSEDGFLPKAHALYKKVLKVKPDHEHALLQGAEIAGSQGLLADARTYLNALGELRRARKDARGVAQVRIRLAMLDPADYVARFAAARARIDVKDSEGALRDFKELALELAEKKRETEAIEALREAAILSPDDPEVRRQLLQIYMTTGDFASARECATSSAEFKALAAELEAGGHPDEALAMQREAARLDPTDLALQEHLARVFVARGDLSAAAEYLTIESAGDNPQLLLMVAEIRLRGGKIDEGLEIAKKLLNDDPMRRQDVAMVGWTIAEVAPDAGFRIVELAADVAVVQADWPSAAAALQEFVTRVPNHIAALMRLVEICVDGGLEATMYSAQAQLADAYITAGSAAEARFIAEDLVAREPWDRANIERFRRALVLMGEPDPDGLIAERLSGQSPFMSTDLSLKGDELPPFDPNAPVARPKALSTVLPEIQKPETAVVPDTAAQARDRGAAGAIPPPPSPKAAPALQADQFVLGKNAIDLHSILGEIDKRPTAHGRSESVEVDLSIVLDGIKKPGDPSPVPAPPAVSSKDLDGVFAQLRSDSVRRSTQGGADDEYKRGLALFQAGQIDESIPLLQSASKAPRLRFATASLVGRILRDRGMIPQAVEWLERAAEAPAPSPDEGYSLLYELAEALEATGETARALAICIELQAEAGDYRDVAARVDRLAKVQ
jgi:tetratricopeptide (TPR) repeat protein